MLLACWTPPGPELVLLLCWPQQPGQPSRVHPGPGALTSARALSRGPKTRLPSAPAGLPAIPFYPLGRAGTDPPCRTKHAPTDQKHLPIIWRFTAQSATLVVVRRSPILGVVRVPPAMSVVMGEVARVS